MRKQQHFFKMFFNFCDVPCIVNDTCTNRCVPCWARMIHAQIEVYQVDVSCRMCAFVFHVDIFVSPIVYPIEVGGRDRPFFLVWSMKICPPPTLHFSIAPPECSGGMPPTPNYVCYEFLRFVYILSCILYMRLRNRFLSLLNKVSLLVV